MYNFWFTFVYPLFKNMFCFQIDLREFPRYNLENKKHQLMIMILSNLYFFCQIHILRDVNAKKKKQTSNILKKRFFNCQ